MPLASSAIGVCHEPKSLSDVWRADAASWQYGRPDGVAFRFQVRANKVEPAPSNCRFNLLSKYCWRAALGDERKPRRPQVASVIGRLARSRGAERLAGTTACPNRSVVGPSGKSQCKRPSADPAEEMALDVSGEIASPHLNDAALVNVSGRDVASGDEVSKPRGSVGIIFIVIGCHSDAERCFMPLPLATATSKIPACRASAREHQTR
jgi:hypothetical protein